MLLIFQSILVSGWPGSILVDDIDGLQKLNLFLVNNFDSSFKIDLKVKQLPRRSHKNYLHYFYCILRCFTSSSIYFKIFNFQWNTLICILNKIITLQFTQAYQLYVSLIQW